MLNRFYSNYFAADFLIFLVFFTLFYNNLVGYEGALVLMLLYVVGSFFKSDALFNNGFFLKLGKGFYLILFFCFMYIFIKFFSIYINQCCFENASRYYAKYSKILYLFVFFIFLVVINFNLKSYERFLLAI